MKILDANYIIRLFIRDDEEMARAAIETINNKSYSDQVYKKDRTLVSSALLSLLDIDTVSAKEEYLLRYGIELFGRTTLDFVDCLLCAYQIAGGYEVCTFDKKLNKLIEREAQK